MENNVLTINSLMVDKRMTDYRDEKELHTFWDLFALCISHERVDKELAENTNKYYGNKVEARNTLIRKELEEKGLFISARAEYAKATCDKILLSFRTLVFSWSTGGKSFAAGEGTIDRYKKLPIMYLSDLYNHDKITDVEELSELADSVIIKIIEEYHSFEAIRSCATFYRNRPNIGKNIPIYRDAIGYVTKLAEHVREAGINETYFQNAGSHIKQYRDMLDPMKETPEDFKIFIGSGDKSTSQIRHDVEETLVQYIKTLIQFTQIQTKATKDEVKNDIDGFLAETQYNIHKLGYEVSPVYKTTLDKLMFKKSGWEIKSLPAKK